MSESTHCHTVICSECGNPRFEYVPHTCYADYADLKRKAASAWLLEAAWKECGEPVYLVACDNERFEWKRSSHNSALRFARKEDAERFSLALRELLPSLFPLVVPLPSGTEHVWLEPLTDEKVSP